ncbi:MULTISPECIES: helix-turn-helix transcriptional regulator [Streptomyces]|uniref:helix-turn-helix transcriptional regulator n=1 Tax=Streptomyces TaxID=1883 RepID=UPI00211D5B0A|nr:response regulator transcription factor [Streptomyces sp. st115]WSV19725.1 response regulator transcription factor [Streptomyces fimicarius]
MTAAAAAGADRLRFHSAAVSHGRGPMAVPRFEQVTVDVRASDPLSREGVVAQLRPRPEVRLLSSPGSEAHVLVLVADTVDDDVHVQLRHTQRTSDTRTVLIPTQITAQQLVSVAECGIGGIISRADATPEHLVDVICSVALGQGHLPGDLLAQLLTEVGRVQREVLGPRGWHTTRISTRERDVLRLLAEGHDTAEIAKSLSFSVRTIKGTLQGVMDRFQLPNRTAAVAYALRQGLI